MHDIIRSTLSRTPWLAWESGYRSAADSGASETMARLPPPAETAPHARATLAHATLAGRQTDGASSRATRPGPAMLVAEAIALAGTSSG